jgi:hypothetical protein
MIELSVNNELERAWKDAIASSFEILPAKLPLGCEENNEKLSGNSVTEVVFERCSWDCE